MGEWATFAVVCLVGYLLYHADRQRRRQNYLAWAALFEWLERERHGASQSKVMSADYSGNREDHLLKRLDRGLAENLVGNDERLREIFGIDYGRRRRFLEDDDAPPPGDAPKEVRDAWYEREEAEESK